MAVFLDHAGLSGLQGILRRMRTVAAFPGVVLSQRSPDSGAAAEAVAPTRGARADGGGARWRGRIGRRGSGRRGRSRRNWGRDGWRDRGRRRKRRGLERRRRRGDRDRGRRRHNRRRRWRNRRWRHGRHNRRQWRCLRHGRRNRRQWRCLRHGRRNRRQWRRLRHGRRNRRQWRRLRHGRRNRRQWRCLRHGRRNRRQWRRDRRRQRRDRRYERRRHGRRDGRHRWRHGRRGWHGCRDRRHRWRDQRYGRRRHRRRDRRDRLDPDAGVAGAWRPFGGPLQISTTVAANALSMALLPDGSPVVAWNENGQGYTRVWKPAGCDGAWAPLGDPIAGVMLTLLVPTGSDRPVRASVSTDLPPVLRVERWNGSAFEPMGAPFPSSQQTIGSPALVADGDGHRSSAGSTRSTASTPTFRSPAGTAPRGYGSPLRAASSGASRSAAGALSRSRLRRPASLSSPGLRNLSSRWSPSSSPETTWTMLGTAPAAMDGSGAYNGPIVRIEPSRRSLPRIERVGGQPPPRVRGAVRWQRLATLGGALVSAGGTSTTR